MKIAFMFSGQGAQSAGMGRELYENFSKAAQVFDTADEALGFKISELCFQGGDELNTTENTQPAILTMSMAALALLEDVKPDYCLGLSLGEYSALVASGALDFTETVKLVKKRGRFMTEACPEGVGAMSAILNLDGETVAEVCREAADCGFVSAANYNMPGQIVIAGETAAVVKAEEIALAKGAKRCMRLNVSGPFHTAMMRPASQRLETELKAISINEMKTPVLTNLTGELIKSSEDIIPTLINQVMSPVKWEQSVLRLLDFGVNVFVEIGPGKTLCSFVKKICKGRDVTICNVEDLKSFENTMKILKGG